MSQRSRTTCLQEDVSRLARNHVFFGDHYIHRDVMRLRVNCRQRSLTVPDAEDARRGMQDSKGAVKKTTAITEAIARRIEAHQGCNHDIW